VCSRALGKFEQYGFEIGIMNMKRVFLRQLVSASVLLLVALVAPSVHAEDEAPDVLINDKAIRAGDMAKVIALVDTRIMPNVNFQRMTASAVGSGLAPGYSRAAKALAGRVQNLAGAHLCRCAGAGHGSNRFRQAAACFTPRTKRWWCAPKSRAKAMRFSWITGWKRRRVKGAGWSIYNLNVLGVWLVETYRSQFAQEINAKGVDGLIATLAERNKANANNARRADVLVFPEVLTHAQATACLAVCWCKPCAPRPGRPVVVDASCLQRFDSSALAVLLELRRNCLRWASNGRPWFAARLGDLAALYGVMDLLPAA
jgi:phospholipid transport system substrate-binding protein